MPKSVALCVLLLGCGGSVGSSAHDEMRAPEGDRDAGDAQPDGGVDGAVQLDGGPEASADAGPRMCNPDRSDFMITEIRSDDCSPDVRATLRMAAIEPDVTGGCTRRSVDEGSMATCKLARHIDCGPLVVTAVSEELPDGTLEIWAHIEGPGCSGEYEAVAVRDTARPGPRPCP